MILLSEKAIVSPKTDEGKNPGRRQVMQIDFSERAGYADGFDMGATWAQAAHTQRPGDT
jgi:hypothetical protein